MTQRSTTRMPQLTGVDRVTELVPGVSARGVRGVGGTMDLLDDHFPDFPVLPGVLLLGPLAELAAIVEAASLRPGGAGAAAGRGHPRAVPHLRAPRRRPAAGGQAHR